MPRPSSWKPVHGDISLHHSAIDKVTHKQQNVRVATTHHPRISSINIDFVAEDHEREVVGILRSSLLTKGVSVSAVVA